MPSNALQESDADSPPALSGVSNGETLEAPSSCTIFSFSLAVSKNSENFGSQTLLQDPGAQAAPLGSSTTAAEASPRI